MFMIAIGALIFFVCMILAWVARIAQGRGRSVIGWTLGAAVAGGLGLIGGISIVARAVNEDVLGRGGGGDLTLLVGLLVPVMLFVPMVVIGIVLQREPIKVANRKSLPVHFMDRGPGRVSFEDAGVCFEWSGGSQRVALEQVRHVEADGECVRVTCPGDGAELLDFVVMPMGKPDSPAGRRQQSLSLAHRLRAR